MSRAIGLNDHLDKRVMWKQLNGHRRSYVSVDASIYRFSYTLFLQRAKLVEPTGPGKNFGFVIL